jgi:hypothetical protein
VGVKRFTRFAIWLARRLWGQKWLGEHKDIQQYIKQCMVSAASHAITQENPEPFNRYLELFLSARGLSQTL